MIDDVTDAVLNDYINEYGIGVPATFAVVAALCVVIAIPGMFNFDAETVYGKIGVLTLLVIGLVATAAAGYTYREVDLTEHKLTREEDGP